MAVQSRFSISGLVKNIVLILFLILCFLLIKPTYRSVSYHLDQLALERIIENVVAEGEKDKLYGVDQVFSYIQKALNANNIELKARDVVKVSGVKGTYATFTIDYRRDTKLYNNVYVSYIFSKSYDVKMK